MSRPHDGHRSFFPFGNPLRMIIPSRSHLSARLQALLNSFEKTLAERLKMLKPNEKADVLSLSWMRAAMESLSETHTDIKALTTDLQFPVSDWDEKWMGAYLDDSVKLLDICNAFSSEILRLDQGLLLLQYVLHVLDFTNDFPSSDKLLRARASLLAWMQQIGSKALSTVSEPNPKLESCCAVVGGFSKSLYSTKIKTSARGKVLMRAMYGIKAQTIFVCSAFTAALSGSPKPLMDLHVPDKFLWSASFMELQTEVNGEIRRLFSGGSVTILKELEAVGRSVDNLYAIPENTYHRDTSVSHEEAESLRKCVVGLGENAEKLAQGLDLLSKQVNGFFQIVLSGRDALLCNLRLPNVQCEINGEEYVDR